VDTKKKVFISWSGKLSETVAQLFKKWLPNVLHDIEPFFSTEDIRKGRRSVEVILENMKGSKFAISCLTMSNKEKPWIEFEAGFLSGLNIPVAGFLINLSVDDLKLPLSNFQHTLYDKDDMRRLLNAIREVCNSFISQSQFDNSFDREWPTFQETFDKIVSNECIKSIERISTQVVTEERVYEIVQESLNAKLANYHPTEVLNQAEYDELTEKGIIDKDTVYLIV